MTLQNRMARSERKEKDINTHPNDFHCEISLEDYYFYSLAIKIFDIGNRSCHGMLMSWESERHIDLKTGWYLEIKSGGIEGGGEWQVGWQWLWQDWSPVNKLVSVSCRWPKLYWLTISLPPLRFLAFFLLVLYPPILPSLCYMFMFIRMC